MIPAQRVREFTLSRSDYRKDPKRLHDRNPEKEIEIRIFNQNFNGIFRDMTDDG